MHGHCLHGLDLGPSVHRSLLNGSFIMYLHGVRYVISLQVDAMGVLDDKPEVSVVIRSNINEWCTPVFTTHCGGFFGYMTKAITGEDLMVFWASPRELYTLVPVIKKGGQIPIHLVECLVNIQCEYRPVTVVKLRYENMRLLLPPEYKPAIAHVISSHEYTCDLRHPDNSTIYKVMLQCKVMEGGGMVLHAVTLEIWPSASAHNVGEGKCPMYFTPRRASTIPPYTMSSGPPPIFWGSEKRGTPNCR